MNANGDRECVTFTLLYCIKMFYSPENSEQIFMSRRGEKSVEELKTTRDECEIRFIMQTNFESYGPTMCEHNAVFPT